MHPPAQLRVLVVDDSPTNRLLAEEMLKDRGLEADTAGSVMQAVATAARTEYALIFMDIRMADGDGFLATRQIRRLGGRNSDVPIIALTAHCEPEFRAASIAAGMNDLIAKPLDIRHLDVALYRWCGVPLPRESVRTPSNEPAGGALDADVFAALRTGVTPQSLHLLVMRFVAETEDRIGRLRAAAAARDHETARREAHTLKGGATLFGGRQLSEAAAGVEQLALRGEDSMFAVEALANLASATCASLRRSIQTAAS